jgi:hypothetical protein
MMRLSRTGDDESGGKQRVFYVPGVISVFDCSRNTVC